MESVDYVELAHNEYECEHQYNVLYDDIEQVQYFKSRRSLTKRLHAQMLRKEERLKLELQEKKRIAEIEYNLYLLQRNAEISDDCDEFSYLESYF